MPAVAHSPVMRLRRGAPLAATVLAAAVIAGCGSSGPKPATAAAYTRDVERVCREQDTTALQNKIAVIARAKGSQESRIITVLALEDPFIQALVAITPPAGDAPAVNLHAVLTRYLRLGNQAQGADEAGVTTVERSAETQLADPSEAIGEGIAAVGADSCNAGG